MCEELTPENLNYTRLALFWTEKGIDAIRESLVYLLTSKYDEQSFNDVLQNAEVKDTLTKLRGAGPHETITDTQWKQLYNDEDVPTKISQIDFTLSFFLLKHFCQSRQGISRPNEDKDLEWGVAQLKDVAHHLYYCNGQLSNFEFNDNFKRTKTAILTISNLLPSWSTNDKELLEYKQRPVTMQIYQEMIKKINYLEDLEEKKDEGGVREIVLRTMEAETCLTILRSVVGAVMSFVSMMLMVAKGFETMPKSQPFQGFPIYLRRSLVEFYQYEAPHLKVNPTDPNETMSIESIYIRTVLHIDNGNTPNEVIDSYKTLFRVGKSRKEVKRILIQGRTGFGKTAFTLKLAFDWALGKDEILNQFENVFLLSLRKVQEGQSLAQAIKSQLFEGDEKVEELAIEQYIKGNKKVLLVFDGLDEMDTKVSSEFMNIVHGKSLRPVCVLITSVPWQVEDLTLSSKYIHAEIEGFKVTDRSKFISTFFKLKKMLSNSKAKEATRKLLKEITINSLDDISQNPLLLNMLCLLSKNNGTLPNSLSEIYRSFNDWLYQRCRANGKLNDTVKETYDGMIMKLGKFGFDCLLQSTSPLFFNQSEIRDIVGHRAFLVGLISTEKIKGKVGANIQYRFLHQSFQEHIVACYLSEKIKNNEYKQWDKMAKSLSTTEQVLDQERLLLFCSGESEELAKMVLSFLDKTAIQADPSLEGRIKSMSSINQNGHSNIVNKNIRQLLALEAKCLINMKHQADTVICLVQYLFIFLKDSKAVQKAEEIGIIGSKSKMSGSEFWTTLFESESLAVASSESTLPTRPQKDQNVLSMSTQTITYDNQEGIFEAGEDTGPASLDLSEDLSVESLAGTLPQQEHMDTEKTNSPSRFVQESQSIPITHGLTQERSLDTLLDIDNNWREILLDMEDVEAVGMTAPPIKIAVFVKSNGRCGLERFLKEKIGEKDMAEYVVFKDIGNGITLDKQFLPQMSVDMVNNKPPFTQTLTCLVCEKKSGKILGLTCNHDKNLSKAKFFTDSLDGKREIDIGTFYHQISLRYVPEVSKKDEACGSSLTDQTSNVEVTAIAVSKEALEENGKSGTNSGQKFTIVDTFRPKPESAKLQLIKLLSESKWLVQKVGSKTGLTTGRVLFHHYTLNKVDNGKRLKIENAIIVYSMKEQSDTSTNDLVKQADTETYPVQETNKDQKETAKHAGHLKDSQNHIGDSNSSSDRFTEAGDSGSALTTIPADDSSDVTLIGMHLFGSKLEGRACSVAIPMSSVLDRLEAEKRVTLEHRSFTINTGLMKSGIRITNEKHKQTENVNITVPLHGAVKQVAEKTVKLAEAAN